VSAFDLRFGSFEAIFAEAEDGVVVLSLELKVGESVLRKNWGT